MFRRIVAPGLVAAALFGSLAEVPPDPPGWQSPGLVGGAGWPYARQAVTPRQAVGAGYIAGSSVLELPGDKALLIPAGSSDAAVLPLSDPRVGQAVSADRSWLASGAIPGETPGDRAVAERSLLDLRLLTYPDGAVTASWFNSWDYVWPRDAAFAAAAYGVAGHVADAERVLGFLAAVQAPDGMWAARYDATGVAVSDNRLPQVDSLGWVPWSVWFLHTVTGANVSAYWPMVRAAANRASAILGPDGLPPPSSDYWERPPSKTQDPGMPTLGVCGPLLAGLRAAANLARQRGDAHAAASWTAAARRLANAIHRDFAPAGYPRSPVPGGAVDASVTFLAPPFATATPSVVAALRRNERLLRTKSGGLLPGQDYGTYLSWTPETALFALADAGTGDTADANGLWAWLVTHRTSLGAFPEQVDGAGRQAGVAPLDWTESLAILYLAGTQHPLPIP